MTSMLSRDTDADGFIAFFDYDCRAIAYFRLIIDGDTSE